MRTLLSLFFCLGLCLQLSAASEIVLPITDGAVELELVQFIADFDAATDLLGEDRAECSIVYVCTSCRSSCTKTQYCDGGFHGDSMEDWADTIEEQACGG